MVKVEDIKYFFAKSTKSENDKVNKIREHVLATIDNLPSEFLNDPTYGEKWKTLKPEWINTIKELAQQTNVPHYTNYITKLKGGRNCNYDFTIEFYNKTKNVANINLEFKYGGLSIYKLPQFLSIPVKTDFIDNFIKYDEFYYQNYLDNYLDIDKNPTIVKPSFSNYHKLVQKTKTDTLFFTTIDNERNNENRFKKEKLVRESIKEYIKLVTDKFSIEKFKKRINDTQGGKVFILWNNKNFTIDKLDPIIDIEFSHIKKMGNAIVLKTDKVEFSLLLRWKNHMGVYNPAWQISVRLKK